MNVKIKNYITSLAVMLIISISFISPALAADDWMVKEDDELVFDMTVWDEDKVVVDGPFTLIIDDIASNGELTYSIDPDFDVDDEDFGTAFKVDEKKTNSSIAIMLFVVLIWNVDDFDDYKDDLDDNYDDMKDNLDDDYGDNDSIVYSTKKLEYGVEYSLEDTELEKKVYFKIQWDKNGVLKVWETSVVENNDKSGFLIKREGFDILGIIQSIPGYPLGIVLGIFAVSTVGILIKLKKHK